MRFVIIVNGVRSTGQSFQLEAAAREVAKAHRAGHRWDARVATDKLAVNYRLLTDAEAAQLVQATAQVLA